MQAFAPRPLAAVVMSTGIPSAKHRLASCRIYWAKLNDSPGYSLPRRIISSVAACFVDAGGLCSNLYSRVDQVDNPSAMIAKKAGVWYTNRVGEDDESRSRILWLQLPPEAS